MYAPLAAFSSAGKGFLEGKREAADDNLKTYDLMGMEALGKAFQQQQGPIAPIGGPQPPMPGQPSMPAQSQQRMMPPAAPGGQPPMAAAAPPGAPTPGGAPNPGQSSGPPGMPPGGPQAGPEGMPQLDLQSLAARIQQTSPGLPPQAMMAALTRATPLLNAQGKMELAQLRAEQRQQALDTQSRFADIKERGLGGKGGSGDGPKGLMSDDAVDAAAQRYVVTGQMPPNLGRGVQGRADMAAIQNRAAELAKEQGIKPQDLPKKWQEQKAEQTAITRFMSGPQGNTVRSLGVVVDHLATMRELGKELGNGDLQAFNRIAQAWAEQTGNPAPTNFDTAKQIVGAEVIKALGVAGAGTMSERKEAADAFSRAKSPEQLNGAIKSAQKLLAGQLHGLRRQFVSSTGLKADKFDEMVGPEAKGFLEGGSSAPAVTAPGGWSIQRVD